MKKFINEPKNFVDEMLEGILLAHPDQLSYVSGDRRCIVRAGKPKKGKVCIATGGGSGHLPLFLGYVGEGMLDGCSVGGVFQSPSAERMLNVTKAIDAGVGVLYIYGNYSGDAMNFDMAKEMAAMDNIRVEQVIGTDDVASAPRGQEHKRRGVAGIFFLYKCAGAMACTAASLDEVKRVAEKAAANVRTMGVALSPNTVPEVGKPQFSIGENEMEIGMGIHGEPGIRRGALKRVDTIVDEMLGTVLSDLPFASGDKVAVLVNGLGATPKEEMYLIFRKVGLVLQEKNIAIYHAYVGEFATSLDMSGASISLLRLDDELARLLSMPARTPFFEQAQL
ncbi:MAG: dihydroxyacetone kinase subunit DhaK [Spirochaetia bacterium]|jgi:dihydroxyacetone kinase-like protein